MRKIVYFFLGLPVLVLGVLFLVFFLSALGVSQEPETLPDRGFHNNPSCDPRGSSKSVRCGCLGMVHQVQEAIVKKCWALVGVDDPEGLEQRFAPPQVLDCLETEDQRHCQIVARYTETNESMFGITVKRPDHVCKTSCLPQNCHCADEGNTCAAHGETEEY